MNYIDNCEIRTAYSVLSQERTNKFWCFCIVSDNFLFLCFCMHFNQEQLPMQSVFHEHLLIMSIIILSVHFKTRLQCISITVYKFGAVSSTDKLLLVSCGVKGPATCIIDKDPETQDSPNMDMLDCGPIYLFSCCYGQLTSLKDCPANSSLKMQCCTQRKWVEIEDLHLPLNQLEIIRGLKMFYEIL